MEKKRKITITFFDIEKKKEINKIKNSLEKFHKNIELKFFRTSINHTDENKYKNSEIISIFTKSKLTKEELSKFKNLKLIITRSAGTDHIDLKIAKKLKIDVENIPTYSPETVAEHTLALILTITRKICFENQKIKKGIYTIYGEEKKDLKEQTIGVIGFGHIGKALIKYLKPFKTKIIVYEKKIDADKIKEAEKLNIKLIDKIEELYRRSDIITLHIPLTKETKKIINKESIKLMKKGTILINTSRGGLIDTSAVLEALNEKKISYLGLDVLEYEEYLNLEEEKIEKINKKEICKTLLITKKLIENPNVIITPHTAFNTSYARNQILKETIKKIKKKIMEINKI